MDGASSAALDSDRELAMRKDYIQGGRKPARIIPLSSVPPASAEYSARIPKKITKYGRRLSLFSGCLEDPSRDSL